MLWSRRTTNILQAPPLEAFILDPKSMIFLSKSHPYCTTIGPLPLKRPLIFVSPEIINSWGFLLENSTGIVRQERLVCFGELSLLEFWDSEQKKIYSFEAQEADLSISGI